MAGRKTYSKPKYSGGAFGAGGTGGATSTPRKRPLTSDERVASQLEAREAAFAKPGTGQFPAGALTEKGRSGVRDNKTVAPSVESRFVKLPSGKTGTKMDVLDVNTPRAPGFDITQSPAFQAKANAALSPQPKPAGFGDEGPVDFKSQILQEQQINAPGEQSMAMDVMQKMNAGISGWNALNVMPGGGLVAGFTTVRVRLIHASVGLKAVKAVVNVAKKEMAQTGVINTAKKGVIGLSAKGLSVLKSIFWKGADGEVRIANFVDDAGNVVKKALPVAGQLRKAPVALAAAGAIIYGALSVVEKVWSGTKGQQDFGRFLGQEGIGSLGMAGWNAKDNPELQMQVIDEIDDAINRTRNIQATPLGTAEGVGVYLDSAQFANNVNRKVIQDKIDNPQMSYLEQSMQAEIFKTQQAEIRTQKYIDMTSLAEAEAQKLRDARTAQQIAQGRADREASSDERDAEMRRQAEFWLEYKKQIAQMEEEERIEQAKFWFEYKKAVLLLEQKAREDNGRSSLHFGLLR